MNLKEYLDDLFGIDCFEINEREVFDDEFYAVIFDSRNSFDTFLESLELNLHLKQYIIDIGYSDCVVHIEKNFKGEL